MPYYKILKKVIAERNLTHKEIAKKCCEMGTNLTASYISKLVNNKMPAPSDKISRTIAKVCNIDERLLVIEGYIDKAPKEILEMFNNMRKISLREGLKVLENDISKENLEKIIEIYNNEPVSEFLLPIIENDDSTNILIDKNNINIKDNYNQIELSLKEPISIQIKDNSMFPIIQEGASITLEIKQKYNDGDILALKIKKDDNIIVRYILFKNDKIITNSIKNNKPITYNLDDVVILGKVNKVITKI